MLLVLCNILWYDGIGIYISSLYSYSFKPTQGRLHQYRGCPSQLITRWADDEQNAAVHIVSPSTTFSKELKNDGIVGEIWLSGPSMIFSLGLVMVHDNDGNTASRWHSSSLCDIHRSQHSVEWAVYQG